MDRSCRCGKWSRWEWGKSAVVDWRAYHSPQLPTCGVVVGVELMLLLGSCTYPRQRLLLVPFDRRILRTIASLGTSRAAEAKGVGNTGVQGGCTHIEERLSVTPEAHNGIVWLGCVSLSWFDYESGAAAAAAEVVRRRNPPAVHLSARVLGATPV